MTAHAYEPEGVIAALLDIAREEILKVFTPESCIASTRITLDVLQYFGVPGKPIPVAVTIFNEEARQILDRDGLDAVAAAVNARSTQDVDGPWTIGLGVATPAREPGAGHVAVAIPSLSTIVDLSLDQANRARKNITLGPVALKIPDDLAFMREPGERIVYTIRSTPEAAPVTVMYQHEREHRYRQSPNWLRKSGENANGSEGFRIVTASIIQRMRHDLEQS